MIRFDLPGGIELKNVHFGKVFRILHFIEIMYTTKRRTLIFENEMSFYSTIFYISVVNIRYINDSDAVSITQIEVLFYEFVRSVQYNPKLSNFSIILSLCSIGLLRAYIEQHFYLCR